MGTAVLQATGCLWHQVGEPALHQRRACARQQVSWCGSTAGFAREETGAGWRPDKHPNLCSLLCKLPCISQGQPWEQLSSPLPTGTTAPLSVPFSISPFIRLSMVGSARWPVLAARPLPAFSCDRHRLLQTRCDTTPWVQGLFYPGAEGGEGVSFASSSVTATFREIPLTSG